MKVKNADIVDRIIKARDTKTRTRPGPKGNRPRKARVFRNQTKSSLRYSLRFLIFHQIKNDDGEWEDEDLGEDESPSINTFSDVAVMRGIVSPQELNRNMAQPIDQAISAYKLAISHEKKRHIRVELLNADATYRVYEKRIDGKYPLRPAEKFNPLKRKW